MHKHRCPDCGFIWEHSDSCSQFSHELFEESHVCAKCGQVQTLKYFGQQTPALREICTADRLQEVV